MTLRVLLVDDDHDMTELTKEFFEILEIASDTCGSVEEALKAVAAHRYDAVVTDITLNGEATGLDLCEKLVERHPELTVVVMSGDPASKEPALRIGATAFFTKPVDLSAVAEFIRSRVR